MATTARRPVRRQQEMQCPPILSSADPSPEIFERLREPEYLAEILLHLEALNHGQTSARLPDSWAGLAGRLARSFNQLAVSHEQMASALLAGTKSPQMHEELLNIASEAVLVRSLGNTILYWNPGAEKLYGWSREEVLGKDIHLLLRTVFPVPRQEIDSALHQQKAWQGNLVQTTKSGSEIVVACRKSLNHAGDAVLEVGRDITAQLRAEVTLRETEKLAAMGRLAGIIAHEINNPLAAVTNILYLLRSNTSLDADARRCADMAEEELHRVSDITRQTLSFYREARRPIAVDLPQLLQDVLGLHARTLKSGRIELRTSFSSTAVVRGFPAELRQVFLNLISNALQAMPGGGTLGVRVRHATDWKTLRHGILISILDTGKGIGAEDAPHLFEPFFSTKSTQGTGLGLWISKGIIQKNDGRISYRTYRHLGGCMTCFSVFLPAVELPADSTEHESTTALPSGAGILADLKH